MLDIVLVGNRAVFDLPEGANTNDIHVIPSGGEATEHVDVDDNQASFVPVQGKSYTICVGTSRGPVHGNFDYT